MSSAQNKQKKIGVVLLNMGGPDSLDNIRPFLANLFSDREIIQLPGPFFFQKIFAYFIARKRAQHVRERYELIGGKSPQLDITLKQAAGFEVLLNQSASDNQFKTFVAMRYWHPLTNETVQDIVKSEIDHLVALPLYPHYCRATSGSSFNELKRCLNTQKAGFPVTYIDSWYNHPAYLRCQAKRINEALNQFPPEKREAVKIVYSAHSIPQKFVDEGDPYLDEVKKTIEGLTPLLNGKEGFLTFQSRSGPVEWVGPDTAETMVKLGSSGVKDLLMVPISFTSDHVETLYEMDVMYKQAFLDAGGKHFKRAATFNEDPDFLAALNNLVLEHLDRIS